MWLKIFFGWTAYGVGLAALLQADIVSDGFFRIAEQFPILIAVMGFAYWMQKIQRDDAATRREYQREDAEINRAQKKEDAAESRQWLEKMLSMQREILTDTHKDNQKFLTALLGQIETKQNQMADEIKELATQLGINTSVVSEVSKINELLGMVSKIKDSPE